MVFFNAFYVVKSAIFSCFGVLMKNKYLRTLLEELLVKDEKLATAFKKSSAAKSVHHGFVGGLLQHTLSVVKMCDYYCSVYPLLKRDLLLLWYNITDR